MEQVATLSAFETTAVVKDPTYNVDEFAPRGLVSVNAKGEPVVTCSIGTHAKSSAPALVCQSGTTQTGMKLEVIGAAIRDGVIPPETIKALQEKGGVYDPALHESDEDEALEQ